jgi:hypothetical protein
MADIIIAGTTYGGTPSTPGTPARPLMPIEREHKIIGRTVEAMNGDVSVIYRGSKWVFTLKWGPRASVATKTAVRAARALAAPFAYTDEEGVVWTVINVPESSYIEMVKTDRANTYQYELALILRQA